MATDKTAVWADGEAQLWYSPNSTLDVVWNDGEAWCLDEYVAAGGISIPVVQSLRNMGVIA